MSAESANGPTERPAAEAAPDRPGGPGGGLRAASVGETFAAPGLDVVLGMARGGFVLEAAFAVPAGTTTVLLGPTGAGKTSILNCIAGSERPARGRIVVGGVPVFDQLRGLDLSGRRRPLALVTPGGLPPRRRVQDLLAQATTAGGDPRPEDVAALLGLLPLADTRTDRLSPGERRRVVLGRALLAGRRAVLVDGLLGGLDDRERELLARAARRLGQLGVTILYACHDAREAARIADAVVLLEAGRVVASGPIGGLSQSEAHHARLADAGTVTEARVCGKDLVNGLIELRVGSGIVRVPAFAATVGQRVRVRLDPAEVTLATASRDAVQRGGLPGTVCARIPLPRGRLDIGVACGPVTVWSRIDASRAGAPEAALGGGVFAQVAQVEIL